MKAKILYDAQNDGVISGEDMQEFFMQEFGRYSVSGNESLYTALNGKMLIENSLQAQVANSPSMLEWARAMAEKYGVKAPESAAAFWSRRRRR